MSLVCPVGPEANLLEVGPEHCGRLVIENPIMTLEEMQVCLFVCLALPLLLLLPRSVFCEEEKVVPKI